MTKKNTESLALTEEQIEKGLKILKKTNKLAKKRNRWAKRQYQQSLLDYEQSERLYLIEKSKLQPTFRLSITEFLMCEPDYLNDPEQASEAKFLSGLGVAIDERVLRIKVHVKGEAYYMRPNLVIERLDESDDGQAYSMSELIYFLPVSMLRNAEENGIANVYFVYRDKTTLPVIHHYQMSPQADSALRRWNANHIDTVYANSRQQLSALTSASVCAKLFVDR